MSNHVLERGFRSLLLTYSLERLIHALLEVVHERADMAEHLGDLDQTARLRHVARYLTLAESIARCLDLTK